MFRLLKKTIIAFGLLSVGALVLGGLWLRSTLNAVFEPPLPLPDSEFIADAPAPPLRSTATEPIEVEDESPFTIEDVLNPKTQYRPWARWWWPGADVEAELLIAQLDELQAAGFGGVEIQPFRLGVGDIEDAATRQRILEFDSPRYYKVLSDLMSHASSIGMQVHLNHLSGWPGGGPQVPLQAGMYEYQFAEQRVRGGGETTIELPTPSPGLNAYAMGLFEIAQGVDGYNFPRGYEKLVSVLAGRVDSGKRSWNPLDGTDTLRLDPTSIVVLDDRVSGGSVTWHFPDGEWVVVATYLTPSGEPPVLVARETPGFVIDHLDSDRLRAHYDYAFGTRTGLDRYYGQSFQGIFNDSLEYKLDVMASADLLTEFEKRKGYDLRPFLPALAIDGLDNFYLRDAARFRAAPRYRLSEDDERVRNDFLELRSELLIERFIEASTEWATKRGLKSRAQSYGSDIDVIRALGANHIPETEQLYAGGSELFLKLASSAGHLYGRKTVSSESFVWKDRDYAVAPKHLKAATDRLLYAGINQIIYHGVTYRTNNQTNHPVYLSQFGELGWYPWSYANYNLSFSSNIGPESPLWDVTPDLNTYITRLQALLRQGRASVDAYIYYPFMGMPTSFETIALANKEFLANGFLPGDRPTTNGDTVLEIPLLKQPSENKDPRITWLSNTQPLIHSLNGAGITWRFINDHALQQGLMGANTNSNAASRPVLLLTDIETMPVETARVVEEQLGKAHKLIIRGAPPSRVPGLLNAAEDEHELGELFARLSDGRIQHSIASTVAEIESTIRFATPTTIRRHSRQLKDGRSIHFFANQSTVSVMTMLDTALDSTDNSLLWFDAMSGAVWSAESEASGELSLSLGPLQSLVLLQGFTNPKLSKSPAWLEAVATDWESLELTDWQATDPGQAVVAEGKLAELKGLDQFQYSRTLSYTTKLDRAAIPRRSRYLLDLGDIDGVPELTVNGKSLEVPGFAPQVVDLSLIGTEGDVDIEIVVKAPLRNALIKRALDGDPMYKQHLKYTDQITAAGLTGPVRFLSR